MRWRIDLAYDGSDFHGWAVQHGVRTVQGELEKWLTWILGEPTTLTVAGRTDAGVHARGQVAHFDSDKDVSGEELARRLNRALSKDIAIRAISPAPDGFDARFAAIERHYCFRLWDNDSQPDPVLRNHILAVHETLNVPLMADTAKAVLGLRDFVAFSKLRPGASTIRELRVFDIARLDDRCATIEATLVADAFTHSMVRSLMGALVLVGAGKRSPEWFAALGSATERPSDVPVLQPSGLTLEAVIYPPDDQLAARVIQARNQRTEADL